MANRSKIDKYIIKQVRLKRIELGYSQFRLGLELDLSSSFIGNIESNTKTAKWNLSHLNELAKLFRCSPKDFLPLEPLK